MAPGPAPLDSVSRLARSAVLAMDADSPEPWKLSQVAASLGITGRHLRRVFVAEYGVSPVRYLQTKRLLLAKHLLTDTRLTATDVAMAAGFGSIRRFNDLFKKHYRLTPCELRQNGRSPDRDGDSIALSLGYRPPYAWDSLISFLSARAIPGVESVTKDFYRRTVAIRKGKTIHHGWLAVTNEPARNVLAVTLATTLLPVLSQVLARVRFLFDLNCNPQEVYEKLAPLDEIAPGIRVPGIRLPGCFDTFEMSVRTVLGQQVTVKAAGTLAMRLVKLAGEKIVTPFEDLTYTFPRPEKISELRGLIESRPGQLGITSGRVRAIFALAEALTSDSIRLFNGGDIEQTMGKLSELPGFGPWTVKYIAMRAMGWPDAFPHTDLGVRKALSNRPLQEIVELSRAWSPWRSYATILLWNFLQSKSGIRKENRFK